MPRDHSGGGWSWRHLVRSTLDNIATLVPSRPLLRAIARTGRRAVRATPLPPVPRQERAWVHEGHMRAKAIQSRRPGAASHPACGRLIRRRRGDIHLES
jgi:hypothetical protein